jgi:uncharacterized protein (TIGR01777 family)
MKTIVIAGSTGFIGQELTEHFKSKNWFVSTINRQALDQGVAWSDLDGIKMLLGKADVLINLAGKSVDCRYTSANREAIFNSRVNTTSTLHRAMEALEQKPSVWLNASTATIYRHAEDKPMNENSGEIGTGFSVHVARLWEHTFFERSYDNVRQVALRMTIVLGRTGGAFPILLKLSRWHLGGIHGSGKQRFSFIHIHDLLHAIDHIISRTELNGPVNIGTPYPVTNKAFSQALSSKINQQVQIPLSEFLLKFGAFFIRTEPELLLKSRWISPMKLLQTDFTFQYPTIDESLNDLLK